MSQPVVSRTVRELERSLGVDLFSRTTRSVTLTPEGAELFAIVTDLLDRFDNALDRFASYCRGEYGRIVITTLPSLAAGLLPSVLVDFLAEHPDMRIEILDVTTTEASQYVQSGKADIAIATPGPETAPLDVQVLLRDRFVAVMADTHALARKRSVTWKALAVEPFIAMSAGSSVRQLTDVAMAQAEASPTTLVEARNIATAGGIIAAGLGVSAFPELVLPLLAFAVVVTCELRETDRGP